MINTSQSVTQLYMEYLAVSKTAKAKSTTIEYLVVASFAGVTTHSKTVRPIPSLLPIPSQTEVSPGNETKYVPGNVHAVDRTSSTPA